MVSSPVRQDCAIHIEALKGEDKCGHLSGMGRLLQGKEKATEERPPAPGLLYLLGWFCSESLLLLQRWDADGSGLCCCPMRVWGTRRDRSGGMTGPSLALLF